MNENTADKRAHGWVPKGFRRGLAAVGLVAAMAMAGAPGAEAGLQVASPKCKGETVTVDIGAGESPTRKSDVILGTNGNDYIDGLGGDDVICGLAGDDVLIGSEGDDEINAGPGDDTVIGGDGDDVLDGWGGDDLLLGMAGADILTGDAGVDSMFGGSGDDVLYNLGLDEDVVMDGGTGTDFCDPQAGGAIRYFCEIFA